MTKLILAKIISAKRQSAGLIQSNELQLAKLLPLTLP